ncbi:MAG: phosphoribosylformylglycinamidine synthase subunit PurL [Bacteroidia bacterium]|nr:phosphoribosylformylglycinamidine synthase subunit PurL [Bacteroidia bacterium]
MRIDTSPTTVETAQKLGLLSEEYHRITEILGHEPNFLELSVYSVMWSEHCSYKNSILWLKKLPRAGKGVLAGAGEENAGLMDIGDRLAVCFKIESHNHPSAIEPYQGAATGVGGIHRDIFTMGARPIAALNSLRFGDLSLPKTTQLLRGVVRGIGDYGNAFGVPTVGGETYFDSCYNVNPLVNAMSVGVLEQNKTASAIAIGIGNPVYIVGSATGKDGIHGATFASADLTENSAEQLPAVQVGDPFTEKLLLEATLEAIATGAVVGVQDMGAAGITCSTAEMSAKGSVGMDIWLNQVPTRQANMHGFEILLSESQERMLIVADKNKTAAIEAVFQKWDLPCTQIGVVTDSGMIRYFDNTELLGSVPAESLVLGGGAPVYERQFQEPDRFKKRQKPDLSSVFADFDFPKSLALVLAHPNIASKKWIYRQYDSMVGTANLTTHKPSAAPIVKIHNTSKAIAMTVDCNSRYVYADPFLGCAHAVAEAARNIACTGAKPLGITNCLNFGNPYNTEVYWQFTQAILGMKAACEAFLLPVTGGNVSFYNQSSFEGPVYPTPTIGMVGLMDNFSEQHIGIAFRNPGDILFVVGQQQLDLNSSVLLQINHIESDFAPYLDLSEELKLHRFLQDSNTHKWLQTANDVSEGGLVITLIESAIVGKFGIKVKNPTDLHSALFWFSESAGRVLVSVSPQNETNVLALAQKQNIPIHKIGTVIETSEIQIDEVANDIESLQKLYESTLPQYVSN